MLYEVQNKSVIHVVHHVLFSCTKVTSALRAKMRNERMPCACMCFTHGHFNQIEQRSAQKARPAGSVSNGLPNEHGEHGAQSWLRLHISFFLNCGHSYDVAM